MQLNLNQLNAGAFRGMGYALPGYDIAAMQKKTIQAPTWLHFGAGNILRAFPCVLLDRMLTEGLTDTGMIVAETYDEEIIDKAFTPFDNLCVAMSLKSDGSVDKRIVGSIAQALAYSRSKARMEEVFTSSSLQLVTLTITEKGYAVESAPGQPLRYCANDFTDMRAPVSIMGILTRLLYIRYQAGAMPLALTSLDNCSHNGDILKKGVFTIARAWHALHLVDDGFMAYLSDDQRVSFTWSMIDKITPRPAEAVLAMLEKDGLEGCGLTVTSKNTYVSAMVNAEECQYLAIEDHFPAGRPPLERVGVMMTTRETVDRIEKMKVCTCLNPLHTALAIFGCLMGYTRISDEMKDDVLPALIRRIGYDEGMPVVVDPGVMSARDFIAEVITKRFPNPFVPDTPQRIACDTSKKLCVRFGETLKAYRAAGKSDLGFLTFIPLVFAGYARYLSGIGDDGEAFTLSPDPGLAALTPCVSGFELGKRFDTATLRPLYSNEAVFGVNLYDCGLGERAERMFAEMSAAPGAIRATLRAYLAQI